MSLGCVCISVKHSPLHRPTSMVDRLGVMSCGIPQTNKARGGEVFWSQRAVMQLVRRWNLVSQTPPTVFKSSQWNLLYMFHMTCRWAWHNLWEAQIKGFRVMLLFSNFFYFHKSLFSVSKRGFLWQSGDKGYTHSLITISERSRLSLRVFSSQ